MSMVKNTKHKLSNVVRSELSRINLKCVIIGAVVTLICGFLSAFAGGSAMVYRELELPPFAPPGFIFGIVWTVLYILIGGAAGAVACACQRSLDSYKFKGLLFFVIMMIFNFIWYPLFFGAGAFFSAFIAIIMMIILTILTAGQFFKVYKISGAVMIIYLLWLIFAAYLNLGVIILN